MKNDFGYFGKGVEGYIHYMQAQDETGDGGKRVKKSGSGGDGGGDGSLKIVIIALSVIAILFLISKLVG